MSSEIPEHSEAFAAVCEMEDLVQSIRDYAELTHAVSVDLSSEGDDRIAPAVYRLSVLTREAADEIEAKRCILWREVHPRKDSLDSENAVGSEDDN